MNQKTYNLIKKYYTARIDIKNFGNQDNDIVILDNNDNNSIIVRPNWFKNDFGIGTCIKSYEGSLDLKIKCINDGKLKILLKSPDIKSKNHQKFPVYIEYVDFKVNENKIINENVLVWHDKPYIFNKDVFDSEVISLHMEWLPFDESNEFDVKDLNNQIQSLKKELSLRDNQIQSFKKELSLRNKQIRSIPQLSNTSLGTKALGGKITYRNWRAGNRKRTLMEDLEGYCENIWFTRYLKHKFPNEDFDINIFSVTNKHDNLAYPMFGKKVLYSLENLNYRYLELKFRFDRYALDYVDLAMGFDVIDHPKYLRFPFWLLKHFPPETTEEYIERKVDMWNSSSYEKSKNIAAIASHDEWGTRTLINNTIKNLTEISYAGKWNNNTSELWNEFNDNKVAYLKQFKFNLCPENILDDGYVTEKIFDSMNCDCIPLYAGGGNYLEPEVLNPNAIIRWFADEEEYDYVPDIEKNALMGVNDVRYKLKWIANDETNSDSVELLKNLLTDEKTYEEFKDQDKLLDSSTKYIIKKFSDLEKHFERLIYI